MMLIISEKLNSSIPSVKKVLDLGDGAALKEIIKAQYDRGARLFDVNTAMCADEAGKGKEAIDAVLAFDGCGVVIDSPDVSVTEEMLLYVGGRAETVINSVSVSERHENIDLAVKYGSGIIVMLTDEEGIPDSAEKRFENAVKMISLLNSKGISGDRIFIDPIIETVAVNDTAAVIALDTISMVRNKYPDVHITCGASNVSFGLPKRGVINAAFLSLASYFGMDAPICDIASMNVKGALLAGEVLSGRDEFCMNYIENVTDGN